MFPRLHLSEETIQRLARMLAAWEAGEVQQKSDSREEPQPAAPDFYLARIPSGGLPEMVETIVIDEGEYTGTGSGYTGTGTFGDSFHVTYTPGNTECNIYLVNQGAGIIGGVVKTEIVYNMGVEIAEDTWVLVSRDKGGLWWAVPGAQAVTERYIIHGILDSDMVYDSSPSVVMSVYEHNGTSEVDTGEKITVHNWLLNTGQSIASGTKVIAGYDFNSGRWYVIAASC